MDETGTWIADYVRLRFSRSAARIEVVIVSHYIDNIATMWYMVACFYRWRVT